MRRRDFTIDLLLASTVRIARAQEPAKRFAANEPTLFKTYAAELVGQAPNAIVASTPPAVAAVRQLTGTKPIVFVLRSIP